MCEIDVQTVDIREVRADVVVLKHAQSSFGADAVVVSALTRGSLRKSDVAPAPGSLALVPTNGAIAAPKVLFLGVVPLPQFEYAEIRAFASRAVEVVAERLPDARHLAMTMHGAGYGLDEREAFLSLVAGLLEA